MSASDHEFNCWVYLNENARTADPIALTPEAKRRRARVDPVNHLIDEHDYPIAGDVLEDIKNSGAEILQSSRWLNAVAVSANQAAIANLAAQPVVRRIDIARTLIIPYTEIITAKAEAVTPLSATDYSYGASFFQAEFQDAVKLHQYGLNGTGVKIAMFDSGFRTDLPVFDSLNLAETYDFINGDTDVSDRECDEQSTSFHQDNHGTTTLSVIAGYEPDTLVGIAPKATIALAKTEITCGGQELKIEEYNWIAAAEWADSIGADIISASLGYAVFQDSGSYQLSDVNGDSALITQAADMAAAKNILVVTAAGNSSGFGLDWTTIHLPGDGDSVITVGAVDPDSILSGFSLFGPTYDGRTKPDIVTLGNNVRVASHLGGYRWVGGTSYSTPLVAGGAALALELDNSLTAEQLRQRIKNSGDRYNNPSRQYGYGLFSALRTSSLIQIDRVEPIWIAVGEIETIDITTSGLLTEVPTLTLVSNHQFADFTDNADGTGLLRVSGLDDNPTTARIAIELSVSYYTDTTYITVNTTGAGDQPVAFGPNPFTDSLIFFFTRSGADWNTVSIYNSAGEKVWELFNESPTTADTTIKWNGSNSSGEEVANGVYFAIVQTRDETYRLKLLKIR